MIVSTKTTQSPVLSIIVPTCDRPDTLAACLHSLAKQPNPHVEILVHDNASGEETQRVITMIADRRIIHKRLPQRVSMRENFESAAAAAAGDYLCMIGDDDAMCEGSLNWIVKMLRRHKPEAMCWRHAAYYWPSLSQADIGFYWLHYKYFYGGWQWNNKQALRKRLLSGEIEGLSEGNMLYHGITSRKLYETTKAKLGGVFFGYHIPDIYVHTALLSVEGEGLTGSYIDVDHPLSVYGISSHSNGTSWYVQSDRDKGRETGTGASSPVAEWKKTATADKKVEYSVLTPIRSLKFHEYVVLNRMVDKAIVRHDEIDHACYIKSIVDETAANLWQLQGFNEAVPVRDYEKQAANAVLAQFKDKLGGDYPAPSFRKQLYDQCWLYNQLCNVSVFPDRPDDVNTAVDTLGALLNQRIGLLPRSLLTNRISQFMRERLKKSLQKAYDRNPPKIPTTIP